MSDVHRLPDQDVTLRAATQWIARLNADDVSDADWQEFEARSDAHPLHARTYEEVAATWNTLRAAGPVVRAVSMAQEMNEIAVATPPRRLTLWLS